MDDIIEFIVEVVVEFFGELLGLRALYILGLALPTAAAVFAVITAREGQILLPALLAFAATLTLGLWVLFLPRTFRAIRAREARQAKKTEKTPIPSGTE